MAGVAGQATCRIGPDQSASAARSAATWPFKHESTFFITTAKTSRGTIAIARRTCIAVVGLNPHCGENGLFGTEDDDHIAPAVAAGNTVMCAGANGDFSALTFDEKVRLCAEVTEEVAGRARVIVNAGIPATFETVLPAREFGRPLTCDGTFPPPSIRSGPTPGSGR